MFQDDVDGHCIITVGSPPWDWWGSLRIFCECRHGSTKCWTDRLAQLKDVVLVVTLHLLGYVGDALSFIFPNLSSMVSMARTISGKVVTFSVNFTRDG